MYGGYHHDRRRFQRLKINLSVFYRIESLDVRSITGEGEFEAGMVDLGAGGMSFLVKHYIPAYTKLTLKFILFKSDNQGIVSFNDPIEVSGEVRSSMLTETNEYRLGVCFKDVNHNDRDDLVDFVSSASRPSSHC